MDRGFYVVFSVLVLLALLSTPYPSQTPLPSAADALNPYVLQVMQDYQPGLYPYLLNQDYAHYNGVTRDICYQGHLLLRADPSGSQASHCVGITFEVFFRAMQARNLASGLATDDFNGMNWDQLYDFMLDWYAAKGPKSESNVGVALARYGIGQRVIEPGAAAPGDFVDFLRASGSGHTAVFLRWVQAGGRIVGVEYWSSQNSTQGVGVHTEYFAVPKGGGQVWGNLLPQSVTVTRVSPISDYRRFIALTVWQRMKWSLRRGLGLPSY